MACCSKKACFSSFNLGTLSMMLGFFVAESCVLCLSLAGQTDNVQFETAFVAHVQDRSSSKELEKRKCVCFDAGSSSRLAFLNFSERRSKGWGV